MDLANSVAGIEKLNDSNYDYWKSCLESYLQGQDLWEIVYGADVRTPITDDDLRKWKIKAWKAMFVIKATIQKSMLDHIREATTPKEAWESFVTLFYKTNTARLQMLKNDIRSVSQENLTISQYFMKVKGICSDIAQLDKESQIINARKRRIILRGLKPEYNGFITAIQGWPVQPSLLELESLLANQESLAKQMSGMSMKANEEALFARKDYKHKSKSKVWQDSSQSREAGQGSYQGRETSKNGELAKQGQNWNTRKTWNYYNCGKPGHYARDCTAPRRKFEEGISANSCDDKQNVDSEDDWSALVSIVGGQPNYGRDWIVDSGCSNHMTGDKRKFITKAEYTGKNMVVTANNAKLPIAHIGDTTHSLRLW